MAKDDEQQKAPEKGKHQTQSWLRWMERRRPENARIRRWFGLADAALEDKPKSDKQTD